MNTRIREIAPALLAALAVACGRAQSTPGQGRPSTGRLGSVESPPSECRIDVVRDQDTARPTRRQLTRHGALQELAAQRKQWHSHQPASYRLCIIEGNRLYGVTEADIVDGKVRVARHAEGRDAVDGSIDLNEWSPSAGVTVENLFDQIEQHLNASIRPGNDRARLVVATYDARTGYPISIYSTPEAPVYDADVSMLVRLVVSPAVPLTPASPGEVYDSPKKGRVFSRSRTYDLLLRFTSKDMDDRIRGLWPQLAPAILERGNLVFWRQVGWEPKPDMIGNILGTFKQPSGRSLYLMAFRHNGEDIYVPIGLDDVAIVGEKRAPADVPVEAAVKVVVQEYVDAYSNLSVRAVKRVYPYADEGALTREFSLLHSQRVRLENPDISIRGATATVTGTWSVVVEFLAMPPQKVTTNVTLRLQKKAGTWVIGDRR